MCTALSLMKNAPCFGRTLDHEQHFGEQICFCPRNFFLPFRKLPGLYTHYALLGMARAEAGYPLYFDAMNEKGLAMAGLHFPRTAVYQPLREGKKNLCPFELLPYVLGQAGSIKEARTLLDGLSLYGGESFGPGLPLSPLHWILTDGRETLVLEPLGEGLALYEAPVGVLTNEPPFPFQMQNLENYLGLSPKEPENRAFSGLGLQAHSRSLGALGLPGDLSSMSRFVRGAFFLQNLEAGEREGENAALLLELLGLVSQPKGAARLSAGAPIYTQYRAVYGLREGALFFQSHGDWRPRRLCLFDLPLAGERLELWGMDD